MRPLVVLIVLVRIDSSPSPLGSGVSGSLGGSPGVDNDFAKPYGDERRRRLRMLELQQDIVSPRLSLKLLTLFEVPRRGLMCAPLDDVREQIKSASLGKRSLVPSATSISARRWSS